MLTTEQRNPRTLDFDTMLSLEIVTVINQEDARVPAAIQPCLSIIAALVDRIVAAFNSGGRLIYIGAGTSGRLGVLDASECPPTYGVAPEQVVGLIAGGDGALRHSVEGAEDDAELGAHDVKGIGLNAHDVLVGIAASGRTPYTLGAMRYAREIGAAVGCIVNTPNSEMAQIADYPIVILSGPEVVTGSTRMKSGTTQKLVLNMLSTAAMVRLGKVYSNLMVDVQASNAKLIQRATNIVREVTGAPDPLALYAALSGGGTAPGTFLLESGDFAAGSGERSLLGVRPALTLTAEGRTVTIAAASPNGRSILPWIADRLAAAAARDGYPLPLHRDGDRLQATWPAPPGGPRDEAARVRLPSPLDALRLVACGPRLLARPADRCHLAAGVFSYDLVELFEDLLEGHVLDGHLRSPILGAGAARTTGPLDVFGS